MSTQNERDLLEFGERIGRYGKVAPRPAFRAELRSALLAAPVSFEAPRASRLGWSRVPALRPAVAAILVLALLATAGGVAAASSLPGDSAYGFKRVADLETLVARRSSAVGVGTDEYTAAAGRVDDVLSRVATLPETSQRDAALARASAASTDHLARLQALATRLPEAAQRGIQRAIEVQQRVHGKSNFTPGRSGIPIAPTPGRGGPPSGVPGRP